MYKAFNLKIQPDFFCDKYYEAGKKRKNNLQAVSECELNRFIQSDGVIDGTALSDYWFQSVKSDVFISHSHNDEYLAYALSGWLEEYFDLKVFMDEVVWGSADKLLRKIDNRYCFQPNKQTYNYDKRNLTTSHVHAMLSTAIWSVIDQTEVVIFLNTENSVPLVKNVLNEDSAYTLSPWIFQELMMTKLLRIRPPKRLKSVVESAQHFDEFKSAYKVPISDLQTLEVNLLAKWKKKFSICNSINHGSDANSHPLDVLYQILNNTL